MVSLKERYHQILQADPIAARRSLDFLYAGIADKIVYKDKPIPIILEPGFITPKKLDSYKSMLADAQQVLELIIDIALDNKQPKAEELSLYNDIKEMFNLNEEELALMTLDCGSSQHIAIYRLDLYANGHPFILEFNCDSAGGIMEAYNATELFLELPQFKALQKEGFSFLPDNGPHRILQTLLDSRYQGKAKIMKPTILITDWRDVGSKVEQERLRDFFEAQGYRTILADPRDLVFRDGLLLYNSETIDIVHRRVIVKELTQKFSDIQPFFEAVRAGAVSVINPFSSALGSNKAILAIMSDPRYHTLYDSNVVSFIQKYVPWTRMFNFKPELSLIEKVSHNKDHYVIKQCKSYGGEAVVVGRSKDQGEWLRKIDHILATKDELWIVQEFVDRAFDIFPFVEGDQVVLNKMVFNINPFIIESEYACGIVRLSPPDIYVINAAQGGAQIPMIQYTDSALSA